MELKGEGRRPLSALGSDPVSKVPGCGVEGSSGIMESGSLRLPTHGNQWELVSCASFQASPLKPIGQACSQRRLNHLSQVIPMSEVQTH